MSVLDGVKQVLHRVRVKLYPSNLPENEGKLIARTVNEKTLTFEEVCVAAKERGGWQPRQPQRGRGGLPAGVGAPALRRLRNQLRRDVLDLPNVGGLLENEYEPIDPEKHKISFHHKTLPPLGTLADRIEIVFEGLADTGGYIAEITDVTTGQVSGVVTKGGIATITGDRLKVAGDPATAVLLLVGFAQREYQGDGQSGDQRAEKDCLHGAGTLGRQELLRRGANVLLRQ